MKKMILGAIVLVMTATAWAQDMKYNDANAQVRNVTGFNGIDVATGIELVLTQGNTEAVAVSAMAVEDRDRIKTEVTGGILKIYYEGNRNNKMRWSRKTTALKAYVSAITVKSITVSSGATIKIEGGVKSSDMLLNLSSGGSFKGDIKADEMKVSQGSGAEAKLSGSVKKLTISVSSGANFKGYDFVVGNCNATVSSGGAVEITVSSQLDAKASSGGTVRYKGNCTVSKTTGSGGAVVNKS